MPIGCHQNERTITEEDDRHVLWSGEGVSTFGSSDMAKEALMFEHNKYTDAMFVTVREPGQNAKISVVDVGEILGLPGQVQARIDAANGAVLGLTIQNYAGFRKRLFWRYKMIAVEEAVKFLIATLRANLCIDREYHRAPA